MLIILYVIPVKLQLLCIFSTVIIHKCRSQWPRGLRRRSAALRLLRSWVWIPQGAWMFVCCECCVLSGRGFCDELITRPEESYRLWCVVVCDLETSRMRRPWPALGRSATAKKKFLPLLWRHQIMIINTKSRNGNISTVFIQWTSYVLIFFNHWFT